MAINVTIPSHGTELYNVSLEMTPSELIQVIQDRLTQEERDQPIHLIHSAPKIHQSHPAPRLS
jgi:hypothetical protein